MFDAFMSCDENRAYLTVKSNRPKSCLPSKRRAKWFREILHLLREIPFQLAIYLRAR